MTTPTEVSLPALSPAMDPAYTEDLSGLVKPAACTPAPAELTVMLQLARQRARDNSAAERCVQYVNAYLTGDDDGYHVCGYGCSDWADGSTVETWSNGRRVN